MNATIDSVTILGSRVHCVSLKEAAYLIARWIEDPGAYPRTVVVTGFHGLWVGYQDPEFKGILNSCDLFAPDGIAPVWISRLKGRPISRRVTGAEIMKAYLELADKKGYSSYFYGDTEETLALLRTRVQEHYPGHGIAGTFSPPFRPLNDEEDTEIVEMINATHPDVLWVGLGLPKQERWIHEHRDRLNAKVLIGVGAAFGFMSGKVRKAPDFLGDHGLEWAWRFAAEPRKLWRRDLLDAPRFLFHVFMELTGLRRYD